MFLKDVIIKENKELKNNNWLLTFKDAEIAGKSKVGQFIEVKPENGVNILLRRPISIHRVIGDEISILYKVVGRGTEAITKKRAGDAISILGPLGNGFPEIADKETEVLLVAGGIGIAPFTYAIDKLDNWKLFYGFRNTSEFLLENEFKAYEMSGKAFLTTDDGSYGRKGFVTTVLEEYLQKSTNKKVVFCCGPDIMMKRVSEIAAKYNVKSYISMEDYMGCGIGICVGCVRKIKNPEKPNGWEHKKVCKDGPVFEGGEIIWE